MAHRPINRAFAAGALLVILWGCGGSVAASQSEAPSTAPPSSAGSSPAEPSLATPSSVLPSAENEVEALLPDQMCGVKATKVTLSSEQVMADADEDFKAIIQALGKQVSDVVLASARGPDTSCPTAGILQITGADPGLLQRVFLAEEQKYGHPYTPKTVGGRNVYLCDCPGGKTYVSFHGDSVSFAVARDEASAAATIQLLP